MNTEPDKATLSAARQIDAVCDRFESNWRAGRRPRIEDYVAQAPGALRPGLLGALIEIERELRAATADPPAPDEYRRRFPELAELVTQAALPAGGRPSPPPRDPAAQTQSFREPLVDTSRPRPSGNAPPQGSLPRKIGRFEVRGLLGEGAFGAVYRARDPQLDRDVALKVPREDVAATAEDRERFLREARAAATLSHPHICPVFEAGEADGRLYIAMAFVEGKPLSKLIKPGQGLPARSAAGAVRKLAQALDEAHRKGVVHRDVKPANIIVNQRGEPVVMDFGLARRTAAGDARLTQTGMVMGTPAYMSPEQARGETAEAGPATDIYSLGVVLYELLTSQRPFEGTVTVVLGKILHVEPRPPRELRADLDPRLEAICLKAMAKNVADRFGTMTEFAEALGDYLRQSGAAPPRALPVQPAPPVAPPPASSLPAADTQQVAALFAGLQSEIRSASRRHRIPPWVWAVVGLGFAGIFAILGILLFARTPTATVIVQIDVDVRDPTLTFFLDGRQLEGEDLAGAIELTVGPHVLEVLRDGQPFRTYHLEVKEGAESAVAIVEQPSTAPPEPQDDDGTAQTQPPLDFGAWKSLFDGQSLAGWTGKDGQPAGWRVREGYLEIAPGAGDIVTTEEFGPAFELHVEFWIPAEPGRQGQGRGNSGVYLQGRHEIQILDADSQGNRPEQALGALYGFVAPKAGAGRPAGEWQTFDITYLTPQVTSRGTLLAAGSVDVLLNGVAVIENGPVQAEGLRYADNRLGQPGPILLQDHGSAVRFRNIRIRELPANSDEGFMPLFNGEDLTGWKTHPEAAGDWLVENGMLVGRGAPSHLYSERDDYSDFHLRVEARINSRGNGGVMFRKAFNKDFAGGYEAQIDAENHKAKTGSLYVQGGQPVLTVDPSPAPAGGWFTMDVIAAGTQLIVRVDGRTTVEHVDAGPTWKRGHVALQCFGPGTTIDFRQVLIKELPSDGLAGWQALFPTDDLSGWEGLPGAWKLKDGVLTGTTPAEGLVHNTYFYRRRNFGDFELKCRVRLTGASPNSGIQFRSSVVDPAQHVMRGPHADVGPDVWGGVYGEQFGGWLLQPAADRVRRAERPGDYHDVHVRCVSRRVTTWVNGLKIVEGQIEKMPDAGLLGFQLHHGQAMAVEFSNIQIRELTP